MFNDTPTPLIVIISLHIIFVSSSITDQNDFCHYQHSTIQLSHWVYIAERLKIENPKYLKKKLKFQQPFAVHVYFNIKLFSYMDDGC